MKKYVYKVLGISFLFFRIETVFLSLGTKIVSEGRGIHKMRHNVKWGRLTRYDITSKTWEQLDIVFSQYIEVRMKRYFYKVLGIFFLFLRIATVWSESKRDFEGLRYFSQLVQKSQVKAFVVITSIKKII